MSAVMAEKSDFIHYICFKPNTFSFEQDLNIT